MSLQISADAKEFMLSEHSFWRATSEYEKKKSGLKPLKQACNFTKTPSISEYRADWLQKKLPGLTA